ncbi:MAG: hypothetical protein JSW68_03785, partial [Burkholderiales bacterium]
MSAPEPEAPERTRANGPTAGGGAVAAAPGGGARVTGARAAGAAVPAPWAWALGIVAVLASL